MKISGQEARRFLVRYQGLTDSRALCGADGIMEYLSRAGCIQFDPLNIIGRNADLVLQSRIRDYRPEMLERLLYKDRLLIDAWDKMMSIYPSADWPYLRPVRERMGRQAVSTLKYRDSAEALNHTDTILEAIAQNGPMQPKQLQLGQAGKSRWGHRNLSGAAMDYLFHIGRLGVHSKVNVNKVYDLIENLLPDAILNQPDPFETEYDFIKWYVYRRLGSIGMLWNRSGGGWLAAFLGDRKLRQRVLDELVAEGEVQRVEVEGIPDIFYIRSKDAALLNADGPQEAKAVRFIAPLDNLLWDRDMLSKLFGFDYTWEVYVPAAKRKYGYYVIPVLYGDSFIGRFEPQKSNACMQIKNWWWEEGAPVSDDTTDLVLREMERFAACFHKKDGVHKDTAAIIMGRSR